MVTLDLEMDNHLRGETPFEREAGPRWCVEVAVGTERGNTFEKCW